MTAKVGDIVLATELEKQTRQATLGKSAHITHTAGAQATPLAAGIVSYDATGAAATKLTEQIAGEKVNLVYAGDVLYLDIPSEQSGWLAIRPGGTDALSKQFAPLLASMSQSQNGQVSGMRGVRWEVTSVTASAVTYRVHVTASMVKAQSTKLGLGKLANVPAAGEDITEVISSSGLPQSLVVSVGQLSTLRVRYSGWGPAVLIKAPEGAAAA